MIELYDDNTYTVPGGYRVYNRQTIDSRWPLYMKLAASEMLRDYGYIIMDDDTGYPIDIDRYTRDEIFDSLY